MTPIAGKYIAVKVGYVSTYSIYLGVFGLSRMRCHRDGTNFTYLLGLGIPSAYGENDEIVKMMYTAGL